MDTPLEEQHGGKFDVILHKMTEYILSMLKLLRLWGSSGGLEESGGNDGCETIHNPLGADDMQPMAMTRHQARASRRIQRLREYKQWVHPSCVLVDSPNNLAQYLNQKAVESRLRNFDE